MQAPCADIFKRKIRVVRKLRDFLDRIVGKLHLNALLPNQLDLLSNQIVFRNLSVKILLYLKYFNEIILGERFQLNANRQTAEQLGDQIRWLALAEGAAADEENVVGFDVAPLRVHSRAFDQGKQVPLDPVGRRAFRVGNVALRDSYFVDLVDEDYPLLLDLLQGEFLEVYFLDYFLLELVQQKFD